MGGMSIGECLKKHSMKLIHSDSARLDTEILLADTLSCERAYLYTWPEKQLSASEYTCFQARFDRRLHGEPIAHILGVKEFWSLAFFVNSTTLIPRPETELLVELATNYCFDDGRVLDLGTGTGAIALALASEFPRAEIHAVDCQLGAVALAEKNRSTLSLANVQCYQSDWFSNVSGLFDVIISNPPYIESGDPHLSQGDVRFEPASALVSGGGGLNDIRRICQQAQKFMHDDAWLLIEHGWQQGDAVRQLFAQEGFSNIKTAQDYAGNERVTFGQMLASAI